MLSSGAFIELASRFVDPALGFSLGWNYWYLWVRIWIVEVPNSVFTANLLQGH